MEKYIVIGGDVGGNSGKFACNGNLVEVTSVEAARKDGKMGKPQDGILFDEPPILVGDIALEFGANVDHQRTDENWVVSQEFLHIVYAGCSELFPTQEWVENAMIVVGLPWRTYLTDRARVIEALKGTHTYKRDGRQAQHIQITDVIPMPQGAGAGWSQIYSPAGLVIRPELLNGKFGVIDLGSKHINMVLMNKGIDVEQFCRTFDNGMWLIIERFAQLILEQYDRKLTAPESRAAFLSRSLKNMGATIDCKDIADQAIAYHASEIVNDITALWARNHLWKSFDAIFICGGGALIPVFPREIMRLFTTAVVVKNPVFANAEGNAHYGEWIALRQK